MKNIINKKNNKKANKKETWKYIKKCIPYFMVKKKDLIILIITSLILALASSFFPALAGKILDYVTKGNLNGALILGLISTILLILSDYIENVTFRKSYMVVQDTVANTLKKDIVDAYFNIENKTLIKTPSGVFLTRISSDPSSITSAFNTIRSNISTILTNLLVVFYIAYLNWVLGIIVVLGTILVYVIEKYAMDKWNEYMKRRNKNKDKNSSLISEGIKGVHDIKLLNLVNYFKDKISFNIDTMYDDTIKTFNKDNTYTFIRNLIIEIFTFVVIGLSIYFVKFNIMTVAAVITLFMYKNRLFSSVLYIAWSERNLKEFLLSAKRIFEVIDGNKFPKEKFGNIRVNDLKGNIEFRNVHFSYGKEEVLKGVNFNINEKDTVAIVGKSGSGKTTIINLLNKTYTKNNGKIFIDGNEINTLDKYSLRKNIAVIPQDPYLFNVTINENLKMVNTDSNKKQIENVCKICEIHDYIMTLPKKYNTLIGEGGVNLSGGEKQRLAIARALLMKTNIILFDEATSALDNETQAKIQQAINNISSEYTMLIIAHRLSTIKDCNKILVIDGGKVIGSGDHKTLYETNEIYRTLYENELQK